MFAKTFQTLAVVAGLSLSSLAFAAPATQAPANAPVKVQSNNRVRATKGTNVKSAPKAQPKLQPRTGPASSKRVRSSRSTKSSRRSNSAKPTSASPSAPATK